MIQLQLVGDKIHLSCEYADKDLCAEVGSGIWDKHKAVWVYPVESMLRISQVFKGKTVRLDEALGLALQKQIQRRALLDGIRSNTVALPNHPFLMQHQKQGRAIAEQFDRFAFFYDTGTGKTIMGLQVIKDKDDKFIIVCPKSIIKSAWMEDTEMFFPDVRLLPLSRNMTKEHYVELMVKWKLGTIGHTRQSKDKVKEFLKDYAHAYIINPESFKADINEIKDLPIHGVLVDESTIIKNPQSQITKVLTSYADDMQYAYIMSGKPAPNGPMDYFAQMRIIDPALLGNSFFSFRQRYFRPVGYMGYNWELKDGAEAMIAERLAEKAIFIRKEDCLDLPDKTYLKRLIELPTDAMTHYMTMEKVQLALFDEGAVMAANKVASIMKLRQITSGFLYTQEEDEPFKALHGEKLKELLAVLDEIGDKPVIIWCQFRHEIATIAGALEQMGKSFVTAYSETKDKDAAIKAFKLGEVQYMLAHPKTLKFGVTFTNCTYAIYYSMSHDFEEYYQSHDRIYRKGATLPCTFIFLLAENTIDEVIYTVVQNKGSAANVVEELVRRRR